MQPRAGGILPRGPAGVKVGPESENAPCDHPALAEVRVVGREDEEELVKSLALVVLRSGWKGGDEAADALDTHV